MLGTPEKVCKSKRVPSRTFAPEQLKGFVRASAYPIARSVAPCGLTEFQVLQRASVSLDGNDQWGNAHC